MKILTISQVMNGFRIVEHVEDISEPTREWVFPTKAGMQAFVDDFFDHALNPAEERGPAVQAQASQSIALLTPSLQKALGENIASPNVLFRRLTSRDSAPPPAEPMPLCATECNCTNFKPGTLRFNQDAVNCLNCGGWMSGLRMNIDKAAPCSVDRAITEATQALQELTAEVEAMGGYGGASPTNAWTEEAQAVRSQADAANLESAPKDISDITASLIKRQGL